MYQLKDIFMFRNFLYLLIFLLVTNCTVTGTSFLGPIFTGAKTGSIYQASLSYGTGKVMNKLKTKDSFSTPDTLFIEKSNIEKNPIILNSYMINKVEISDVLEPEPLP